MTKIKLQENKKMADAVQIKAFIDFRAFVKNLTLDQLYALKSVVDYKIYDLREATEA